MKKNQKKISEMNITELESEIQRHNELYFKKANPEISDYDFDRMVERLKKLQPASKILTEIGSDLTPDTKKVEHSSPMLSLDKCYTIEELLKWSEKFSGQISVSPKIDGLAIAIRYDQEGKLYLAETRGDGFKGDEITENVRQIQDIPKQVTEPQIEVRGEVYMPLSIFAKFKDTFANPRNLASGALKQKDPNKTAGYHLKFFAYDLMGLDLESEEKKYALLQKLGFQPAPSFFVQKDKTILQKKYDTFLEQREQVDYETDGVVYRANQVDEQVRLGASAHHPRWAIAYKFQGESGVTFLRDVEWSVSRTGALTPIGLVDPVKLSGASIHRISLHNIGMLKKVGVTLGAKVAVMRRGGVIPHLESVLEKTNREILLPKTCPSCGFPAEIQDDFLFCTNPGGCRKTKLGELEHFLKVLEIDGFGPKLIEQLYDSDLVEELSDFFTLTLDDLIPLDRVGEKLAQKLLKNIESRKKIPLALFLQALGIPELAKHVSEILAKKYRSLENIFQVQKEELSEIHTIGDKIAEHVVAGLQTKRQLIDKLLQHIELQEKTPVQSGKLSGKTFLFTGKMASLKRHDAEKKVNEFGGEIADSVTRDLDYLVIGSEGYRNRQKSNKWIKAESLLQKGAAIEIISEEDFLKML